MKKTILKVLSLSLVAMLSSCGGKKTEEMILNDTREYLFTAVSGEMDNGELVVDDEVDFKSLYEAANYVFDNCENGSYIYRKGDTNKTPLFTKRANEEDIEGSISDQWFYYRDGSTLDGYSQYLSGDTEFFKNEKVTRIMATTDSLKWSYQPYSLYRREVTASTQAWNLLPIQDTSIRYNPHSFTGIRTITFNFKLTDARIRPSYSSDQKVIPFITLSSTDSYNWSNQGIYMDTATGNWYYLKGETQSDTKALTYDTDKVILTSTWDNDTQEFTPDSDVEMTLTYVEVEEETWVNDLTIKTNSGTFDYRYEYSAMNGRGTPRANISLDLVSTNEDIDEATFTPDFMCGAYFKNITITKATGTVPEGLTDEEYAGDADMCCKPGETYDLMANAEKNDADADVILDHYDAISYHEGEENDVWDISYEAKASENARGEEVTNVESLISKIEDSDTSTSASVIKASTAYNKLHTTQAKLVVKHDGYTQLQEALER